MRPEGVTECASDDPLRSLPGALSCVHCGFCNAVCPTFHATGSETDSPRGRIWLMRAAAEERLDREVARRALDRCVLCRACETVCPSKVPYHAMLAAHRERAPLGSVMRFVLRRVLPSRAALRTLGTGLRLLRACGLLGLAERFGPARLRALAGAVPAAASRFVPAPERVFAAQGPRRGRVALHLGCVNAELFGAALRDTVRGLRREGFEVVVPRQPACCGALHAHSGDAGHGRLLAASTAQALAASAGSIDAVIVPAAGCAAHLHEQAPAAGVLDPLVFLHRAGLRAPLGTVRVRAAFDPPCHLQHVLGGAEEVRAVLARVPGVEWVRHRDAEVCCGAGGIAFAREPTLADAVLAAKTAALADPAPDLVVSGNPGCLMRLEVGLRRAGAATEVAHPMSLLARAQDRA